MMNALKELAKARVKMVAKMLKDIGNKVSDEQIKTRIKKQTSNILKFLTSKNTLIFCMVAVVFAILHPMPYHLHETIKALSITLKAIINSLSIIALWFVFILFLIKKGYKYIAIATSMLFIIAIIAERLNFGFLHSQDLFDYTGILFGVGFVLILIHQELSKVVFLKRWGGSF